MVLDIDQLDFNPSFFWTTIDIHCQLMNCVKSEPMFRFYIAKTGLVGFIRLIKIL